MITTPGFQLSPLNPAVAEKAAKRGRPYTREQTFFFAVRAWLL